MKDLLLNLFANADAMVVSDSPLLNFVTICPVNQIVTAAWNGDEGGTASIKIPYASLETAERTGNSFFMHDEDGDELQVSFYATTPITSLP